MVLVMLEDPFVMSSALFNIILSLKSAHTIVNTLKNVSGYMIDNDISPIQVMVALVYFMIDLHTQLL